MCRIDRISPSFVGRDSSSPSPSVMGRLFSVTFSMSISAISMMPPPVPSKRLSDVPTSRKTTLRRLFSSSQSPRPPCPPSTSSSPQKSTRAALHLLQYLWDHKLARPIDWTPDRNKPQPVSNCVSTGSAELVFECDAHKVCADFLRPTWWNVSCLNDEVTCF